MADLTEEHEYRTLPPSSKGSFYRAFTRFMQAAAPAAKLGAVIGGLTAAAIFLTVGAPMLGPGLIGATMTAGVYTGAAALVGSIFTATVFGSINALRSLTDDHFNEQERRAITKEQPAPLLPVIDPELPPPPGLQRPSLSFQDRLHNQPLGTSGVQR